MTHIFDMRCGDNGMEHRFTKINHPWTNGQVERMNRTIKEATVQRYHYDNHEELVPTRVHFRSCEPLLNHLDVSGYLSDLECGPRID
jgi:transposase InsO family protein